MHRRGAATMSLEEIRMSSAELLDKEPLDCGAFGMVSLCCHRDHGLVVLKTVYTGPQRTEFNESLLEEGKIMYRLNHDRIVKLFGVILEDGNYSLVMEFLEKGNLMTFVKTISVPLSIKGRIISEIIEGMSYLSKQGVVHKDLKPENILVDDKFHIKIADLGVASFKTWSKLTKEETNRLRKSKTSTKLEKTGGTLSYMAPEHLKCINAKSTEKSDVYSFAIVVWVILTNKEPYENAINEEQIFVCVMKGDRPDMEQVPLDSPKEIVSVMMCCWDTDPEKRPTFEECYQEYMPFYCQHLGKVIDADVEKLKTEYPAPKDFVKRLQSLQLDCVAESPDPLQADNPNSLRSSQGPNSQNTLNESLFAPCLPNEPVEDEATNEEENLKKKLQDELNYHTCGSRMDKPECQVSASMNEKITEERKRRVSYDPFLKISETSYHKVAAAPCTGTHIGQHGPSALRTSPNSSGGMAQKVDFETSGAGKPYFPHSANKTVGFMPGSKISPERASPEDADDIYTSDYPSPLNTTRVPVPESGGVEPYCMPTPPTEKGKTQGVSPESKGNGAYQPFSAGVQESNNRLPYGPGKVFNSPHQGNQWFIPETKGNVTYQPTSSSDMQGMNGIPLSLGTFFSPGQDTRSSLSIYGGSGIQIGNGNYMHIGEQRFASSEYSAAPDEWLRDILDSKSLLKQQHLELVQENLGKSWKKCARKLGFRETDIDEIDHDYDRDGLKEKVYQMLLKWQMKEGSKGITVGKLATALNGCKRTDLIRSLQQMGID